MPQLTIRLLTDENQALQTEVVQAATRVPAAPQRPS
jgi:hypothetical protein